MESEAVKYPLCLPQWRLGATFLLMKADIVFRRFLTAILGLGLAFGIGCGLGPPPKPSSAPAPAAPAERATADTGAVTDAGGAVYYRGWFQGTQVGDYNHVIVADELRIDRDFWGFGDLSGAQADSLSDVSRFPGRVIVVAYDFKPVMIPEAGGEQAIPVVRTLSFPDIPDFAPPPAVDLEEFDRFVAAAGEFSSRSGAPKGHFTIVNSAIRGDEAWAIAHINSSHPELAGEKALVQMKKVNGSWTGVDYGSGLEPPEWYFFW